MNYFKLSTTVALKQAGKATITTLFKAVAVSLSTENRHG
jgi:hypothetical protein